MRGPLTTKGRFTIRQSRQIPPTDKINTEERQALRKQIADNVYNKDIDKRSRNREATIILGLPGAGKSTFAEPLLQKGALEIDPDLVKPQLPEYDNGIGAFACHEESSAITRGVLEKAMTNGDDFVWPRIDSPEKMLADLKSLKDAGYKVNIKYIDVDPAFDRGLEVAITVVLIIGGYQFYFWAQRQTFYSPSYLVTKLDAFVTFDPRWVWVYSGIYYPMIVLTAFAQDSWSTYATTVGGFLFLLAGQMFFFLRFPVAIPTYWRDNGTTALARKLHPRSMRFMDLVWSYDKYRNSMPSMHVSVATMVDLTISMAWPSFCWVGWLFPVLIGVSALKTKQHYVVDVIPGAIMGATMFYAWHWLLTKV
jgi:membrane-associated phospholipid phosphatase